MLLHCCAGSSPIGRLWEWCTGSQNKAIYAQRGEQSHSWVGLSWESLLTGAALTAWWSSSSM